MSRTPRRNLVLARVGRSSLHAGWVDPQRERDWDLVLVPYEPLDRAALGDWDVADVIPGPKWTGLRELLGRWDGWRAYERVWMPDDDIACSQRTISDMFALAGALGLDLFAPALHEASAYAHFSTMRNRRFHARHVGFVEIMVPGFSRAGLERLLPTFHESETGWGWGLDSVWPKLLDYRGVGILDGTPVLHTRPVGQMRDAELAARVLAESAALLDRHDCEQVHATFAGMDHRRRAMQLTCDELHLELVDGWRYLIERDPRILGWIGEYQRPHFAWDAYPVQGTPTVTDRAARVTRIAG